MNVSMMQSLGFSAQTQKTNANRATSPISNSITAPSFSGVSNAQLATALRALNNIHMASTVSFRGLNEDLNTLRQPMKSCTECNGGESAGEKLCVGQLLRQYDKKMPLQDDSIGAKANIHTDVNKETGKATYTDGFMTISKGPNGEINLDLDVKKPRKDFEPDMGKAAETAMLFEFTENPKVHKDLNSYVIVTKGKPMAVVEDKTLDSVLLTNAGIIEKKDSDEGRYIVQVSKTNATYKPFEVQDIPDVSLEPKFAPSIGKGGELIVSMENGRYVNETIKAITDFIEKVHSGEIDFGPFVAKEGADKMQIAMLAGGYGSRAEHANASSNKILHYSDPESFKNGDESNAQTGKGIMELPTGLNAMTTSFRTLHEAGILNCSKDALELGDNIKLYVNASGTNRGNGGFTLDAYNKMKSDDSKNLLIIPNDAISRVTKAMAETLEKASTGEAAMVMIAKKVKAEDAEGKLGIMQLNPQTNEILNFAEKPSPIEDGYADKDGYCVSNTFQFTVSKEALEAINILEPYFPGKTIKGGESRDWSKCLTPVIKAITDNDDPKVIQKAIADVMTKAVDKKYHAELEANGEFPVKIPIAVAREVKELLRGQKIYAVPTDESWIDAGNLNDLYKTTMDIASGAFKLSATERAHVLDCINTKTGLVTNSPELKAEIESNYDTTGQVVAVRKAPYISNSIVDENKENITFNLAQ